MGTVTNIRKQMTKLEALKKFHSRINPEAFAQSARFIILEARVMLGLTDAPEEDIDSYKPKAFDKLWDVWEEANDRCYFCSDSVDPRDEQYGESRGLCPICAEKMKSYLLVTGR